MIPVIALVGRPNVGKSTLFNRLTRSRDALVANIAGLTRDRQYGEGRVGVSPYIVIDTGGINGDVKGTTQPSHLVPSVDQATISQSLAAIAEADRLLFLVDARAGLTAADEQIAAQLRRQNKPYDLVLNKIDHLDVDQAAADFARLGAATVYPIVAVHGRGVRSMIDAVLMNIGGQQQHADHEPLSPPTAQGIKIGIVGRPNVGKSTLINRLLGETRVVVSEQAGTTRDSIYIPYQRGDQQYTLIDTAGVRRRGKVNAVIEKFSVIKTLQAIKAAHVVVLVLDAHEGLVDQDLHLLDFVLTAGRAVVLAVNKWDGLLEAHKKQVHATLTRRLQFIDFARLLMISAKHGTGVGHLYAAVDEAYRCATQTLATPQLTRILAAAVKAHPPPLVQGRRIKLRYCHAGGTNPPTLVIHGNQTQAVPSSYCRYLENTYRQALQLVGTPVRITFRTPDNPFSGRKNTLTNKQLKKKYRLMAHVKKMQKTKKR